MKKKTFKAIIAAALAVIMLIPCLSASAANNTLVWDFYGYEDVYDYAGEMNVGTTKIPDDASDYIWYSFDVQNEGFYYIHYNYSDMDVWFGIPESFEGLSAYNEKECIYHPSKGGDGAIYYLETGKTIVGFDMFFIGETAAFETEYLGAEITEIKPQYDLIYNYDVYEYEYMGENICEFDANFDITFSEGKTINHYYLEGTSEKEIIKGENTFKTEIYDKEYEFTSNVYYITDYVEGVEISNVEDYLYVSEHYRGIDYNFPEYETIKVKFKDGSTYTVYINDSGAITLPNGREVGFGFDFTETDIGNYYLDVYVGGDCIASYKCEVTKASLEDNIDIMTQVSRNHLSQAAYYLSRAFEIMFEGGVLGFFNGDISESMMRIEWAITSFTGVFNEITYFISYLLS